MVNMSKMVTFVANFLHEFFEFGEADGAVAPGLALHLIERLSKEPLLAEPVRGAPHVVQEVRDACRGIGESDKGASI